MPRPDSSARVRGQAPHPTNATVTNVCGLLTRNKRAWRRRGRFQRRQDVGNSRESSWKRRPTAAALENALGATTHSTHSGATGPAGDAPAAAGAVNVGAPPSGQRGEQRSVRPSEGDDRAMTDIEANSPFKGHPCPFSLALRTVRDASARVNGAFGRTPSPRPTKGWLRSSYMSSASEDR